jgi:hypothetical protein
MEEYVLRAWLAGSAGFVLACTGTETGLVPQRGFDQAAPGKELIPAEWTVAEDTSETGDVTTISLQLPSARHIGGLLDEEAPRLVLRCLDGRVQAFIDTESDSGEGGPQRRQAM